MLRSAFKLLTLFSTMTLASTEHERWAVYYSNQAPLEAFSPFSLLVLDSDYHPNLNLLTGLGKTVLLYLSLGEVEKNRFYYDQVKKKVPLLGENPNWSGSYFVDLRSLDWQTYVIETLIPRLLFKHVQGIFLDTLDNADYLENKDPERHKGMREAAVRLVKAIRLNYPQIKIMLNRGYDLLPELADQVDMVLAESLYTTYDFKDKRYLPVPEEQYQQQVEQLKEVQEKYPKLKLYSLDYWYPSDTKKIQEIYEVERNNGFIPYVSTIALDQVVDVD